MPSPVLKSIFVEIFDFFIFQLIVCGEDLLAILFGLCAAAVVEHTFGSAHFVLADQIHFIL